MIQANFRRSKVGMEVDTRPPIDVHHVDDKGDRNGGKGKQHQSVPVRGRAKFQIPHRRLRQVAPHPASSYIRKRTRKPWRRTRPTRQIPCQNGAKAKTGVQPGVSFT